MEISFGLSADSIGNAIKELKTYKESLDKKCETFCERLMKEGENVAKARISSSPLGNTIVLTLGNVTEEETGGYQAVLTALGQTEVNKPYPPFNTLLAVEFGAGILFNLGEQNPYGSEMGYGVGTFPGQVHAFEKTWFYKGKDGKWHPSHGVQATMPMYAAITQMQDQMLRIGKEVFGKD